MIDKLKNKPNNELLFRVIKIADIAYIISLYFIFGYFIGYYINLFFEKLYGKDLDKKNYYTIILEIASQFLCVGIISYIGRNIIQLFPSPFDTIGGFKHSSVKELVSGSFLTIFLLMFQFTIQDKLNHIQYKYNKINYKIKNYLIL